MYLYQTGSLMIARWDERANQVDLYRSKSTTIPLICCSFCSKMVALDTISCMLLNQCLPSSKAEQHIFFQEGIFCRNVLYVEQETRSDLVELLLITARLLQWNNVASSNASVWLICSKPNLQPITRTKVHQSDIPLSSTCQNESWSKLIQFWNDQKFNRQQRSIDLEVIQVMRE